MLALVRYPVIFDLLQISLFNGLEGAISDNRHAVDSAPLPIRYKYSENLFFSYNSLWKSKYKKSQAVQGLGYGY